MNLQKGPSVALCIAGSLALAAGPALAASQACRKSLDGRWKVSPTTQHFYAVDALDDIETGALGRVATISGRVVKFQNSACHIRKRYQKPTDDVTQEKPDPYPAYREVTFLCAPGEAAPVIWVGADCDVIHFFAKQYPDDGPSFYALSELHRIK